MMLDKEIHFDSLPSEEEIEAILEDNNKATINLANTKESYSPFELGYLSCYSENINGINIEIDSGDEYDIENLWDFTNISYLRLTLQTYKASLDDMNFFMHWLSEADKLEAISIENIPSNHNIILSSIAISISTQKLFPVYMFVIKKPKPKSKSKKIEIPSVSLLRSFFVKEIFLNKKQIERKSNHENIISKIDHSEFHYYGEVDIEENNIFLYINSLNIKINKEIIITFKGEDRNGKFSCGARCVWKSDEGGFYFSPKNIIKYNNAYIKEELYSLRIMDITIGKNGILKFNGIWIKNRNNIKINASLSREKTRRKLEEIKKN